MKNLLLIAYKNGTSDEFAEDQLDTSTYTLKGHASNLIEDWQKGGSLFKFDSYNAVNLTEVISIRYL